MWNIYPNDNVMCIFLLWLSPFVLLWKIFCCQCYQYNHSFLHEVKYFVGWIHPMFNDSILKKVELAACKLTWVSISHHDLKVNWYISTRCHWRFVSLFDWCCTAYWRIRHTYDSSQHHNRREISAASVTTMTVNRWTSLITCLTIIICRRGQNLSTSTDLLS